MVNPNDVVVGKSYQFHFIFPGGFRMGRVPEIGRVMENIVDRIKIRRPDGSIETLYKEKIHHAWPLPNGGKRKARKTRKGRKGRKGTRKAGRKVSRY